MHRRRVGALRGQCQEDAPATNCARVFTWNLVSGNAKLEEVNIQIINTGRELMLGRVLNTHQQWLCRQLANRGYLVNRQVAIDDSGPAIQEAVRDALARADLIITTGGLGPTSDDRTRDLIADLLGLRLVEDRRVVEHIERFFAARNRACPGRVKVQAQVPEGARVLLNVNGTAPGLVIETSGLDPSRPRILLVMLPGPPRELRPMYTEQVLGLIEERFPLENPFAFRLLRSTGLGESLVEEKLSRPLEPLIKAGLDPGYCARPGEVDIQLLARGERAVHLVNEAERTVRDLMGELIFGVDEEQLETVLVRLLTERNLKVAVAESCTGGCIANRLTNVPGASEVFVASLVTYSNQAKERFLGVRPETLARHGAVSEAVAREMAQGALDRTGADLAVSVTGIAGPGGGSEEKPVGTVFIGLATAEEVKAGRFQNPYDRETFKYVTSQQALEWLRRTVLDLRVNHLPNR
jgi:competence/damage-inducible protein CinA-like protein